MMDRKDEIIDLVARLASLIIDERSEMRHEVERLRETVDKLQETVASLSMPEFVVEENHDPAPEIEPEYDESGLGLELEQEAEPEPGEQESEQESGEQEPGLELEQEAEPEPGEQESELEPGEQESGLGLELEQEPEPESEPGEPEPKEQEPGLELELEQEAETEPGEPEPEPGEPESEPESDRQSEPEPELLPEPEPEPVRNSDSEVLRPRDREEQMRDTSEWGMFFGSEMDIDLYDDEQEESIIGDLMDFEEKPEDPLWMTDVPGPAVKSVYDAISNNDRILFIRELFDEDGEQFCLSMDRIDECRDFGQVVKEMRMAFPEWDEQSDVVYQFYMVVRRKFR